jgi:hypothetical protein
MSPIGIETILAVKMKFNKNPRIHLEQSGSKAFAYR